MAKLRKVISGMQTGADITGLECGKAIGLETGGTCPKGCKTDAGPKPEWKELYGLEESDSTNYAVRTHKNVRDSDATLWFGKTGSPGYFCTVNGAKGQKKPYFVNPSEVQLAYIANTYDTVNIAGNRERINPEAILLTKAAFRVLAKVLGKPEPNF